MGALAAQAKSGRRARSRATWITALLFLTPALIMFLLFVVVPVVQAARYSLYSWNGLGPLTDFVGLDNYKEAIASDNFRTAVSNNLLVVFLSLTIQIPFSLMLAVLLNRRFPGRAVFRLIFFLPYVVSEAITGVIFRLLLQPDALIDSGIKGAGMGGLVQDWLGDTTFVMITLFVIISWKYFGFHMIILLAGLQNIPREIEEAALIDGAGRWQSFRYVTLPLLGPTLRVSVFLSTIGALQLFDMIWVMTGGGPIAMGPSGATVDASGTMAIDMFKSGFVKQSMGYSSTLAVLLFLFCFLVALGYQRLVLRRDIEGALTSYSG
jgi:raffinose/stachyose/melibiose transport system permease protein